MRLKLFNFNLNNLNFNRLTDMENPLSELTRLIELFSIPWKKRSITLKKLHEGNELKI